MDSKLRYAGPVRSVTSRPYEADADLRRMYGLLMEARSRANDWRYWHVGELAFSFFMIDCHLDPRRHVRLWHDGGKLVGYATLNDDPFFDWQVLPEYEGKGIEGMHSLQRKCRLSVAARDYSRAAKLPPRIF